MNKAEKMALAPGSDEAVKHGCKCDRMANALGAGAGDGANGKPMFWYSAACPLHHVFVPENPGVA